MIHSTILVREGLLKINIGRPEHPLQDTAGSLVFFEPHLLHSDSFYPFVGLAGFFVAASLVSVD